MKNLISKIRSPKILKRIIVVVLIILVVGLYVFYQNFVGRVKIDNSIISAPVINISPTTPGKISELDVTEGHMVKTGDLLAIVGSQAIRAQTDGLVISSNNEVGGMTSATTPLMQMIKTDDLRVAGTLDENKGLNNIKIGQVVSFTVDALPGKTFWGYVDEIGPTAKTTQAAFSISSERPTQQFEVYARFNSSTYPLIKNGMSAKMVVYTK